MKRLLYSINVDDIQNILTYGIDIRIEIMSTIRQKVAASDTDVGPITNAISNEINPDALNELENNFCVFIEKTLDNLDYTYNIAEKSDSLTGYSIYYENVTKKYRFLDINFPIRVKITDHLFDKKRERDQAEFSRNKLSETYDVPYEYTGFVVQSIATYRDGKVERKYTSYKDIRTDFKRKMYALESYFKELAISKIKHDIIPQKFIGYRKYAIVTMVDTTPRNLNVFSNVDDFLWYIVRQNIFEYSKNNYKLLKFDCTEIYDYEDEMFDEDILYKGKEGKYDVYILD